MKSLHRSADERIVDVLQCFDEHNTPILRTVLVQRIGSCKSGAYELIAALLDAGYLELGSGSLVRLGSKSRHLAGWWRLEREEGAVRPTYDQGQGARDGLGHAPSLLSELSGGLLKRVDTSTYRREGPISIGFSNACTTNHWRHALVKSIQRRARMCAPRVKDLHMTDALDDPVRQAGDIDELVKRGVNILLISAASADDVVLLKKIKEVCDRGIPVVAVDRGTLDSSGLLCVVTASDDAIGATSATWLAETIGCVGTVWMLSGSTGCRPAVVRRDAALQVFARHVGISVQSPSDTQWRREIGFRRVRDMLEIGHPPPTAVWCDSGLQGMGSIEAFLSCGFSRGRIPPHTGGDLNGMYRLAIDHQVAHLGIDFPIAMGARAVETCLQVLEGSPVPQVTHCGLECIISRGHETDSVRADKTAQAHVAWKSADDVVLPI